MFVRFRGWPLCGREALEINSEDPASLDVPDADPWLPGVADLVTRIRQLARDVLAGDAGHGLGTRVEP